MAVSAIVTTGALCVGLAVSQVLLSGASPAPTPPDAPAPKALALASTASAPATTAGLGARPASPGTVVPISAMPPALPALPTPAAAPPVAPVSVDAPVMTPGLAAGAAQAVSGVVQRQVAYRSVEVDQPYIALTFDDGPSPETTPKLLKMLRDRNIKATFFVLGTHASAYPDVLRQIAADGHEIGNHSWNHPQLPKLTVAAADKQVEDTSRAIEEATGAKTVLLRPPYGAMTPALQAHIAQKFGMTFVYWSVDPLDWKVRDPQNIYDQVLKNARPGSIVLAHDIHATTVAAMPRVLDALIAKGFKFATVSQLIDMEKPSAPKVAVALPAAPKKTVRKLQPTTGTATTGTATASAATPKPVSSSATAARDAAKYGLY
ncbi:MAG: hypothetical protein B7Z45_07555 [Azorhizobium sp. 12-66-6]|nr:MAG: hypothetical protein B7Z45_07555 [Azorhizobium sp. 12-66-6]